MAQFVRINKADHPMHGMVGMINLEEYTDDGFTRVMILNLSVNAYLRPSDLQPLEKGTKVIIEVEIRDFFQNSMMIAGGWMSLSRILDIVEPEGDTRT